MFPFEQGALEMVALAALALIVLGPKDMPIVLRRVGQFMAKMRGMAAEFRASFDELARQSEIDELRKEVEALRGGQFGAASSDTPNQAQTHDLPAPDYNPYDNSGLGFEGSGLGVPAEPEAHPTAIEPPKPPRKPRAKKVAAVAEAEPAPAKPARKPRAKKSVLAETPDA